MARLPRLVLPDQPHLVLQRALPARPAFVDEADRQTYAEALREGLTAERVALHAYALLAGEVRLVLTPPSAEALSRLMQHLGRRYVARYHRRHGGRGTLWDGRFRCAPLEAGAACLDALLWVDGASDEPGASSAGRHAGQALPGPGAPPLTEAPVYWALGNTPFERELAYRRQLVDGLPARRAEALATALRGGWAVGSPDFIAALASESGPAGRPARPRPRGRPTTRR